MNKELQTLRAERDSLRAALVRLTDATQGHRNAITIAGLNELCDAEDFALATLAGIAPPFDLQARKRALHNPLFPALKAVVECPDYRHIQTHEMSAARAAIERIERAAGNPPADDLLEALKSVVAGYQQLFDSMPVAWETYDHIAREAIARAELAAEEEP